ncbi:MAG: adenylyltransferase/cytidyltransferase family protein [Patescibacteria group bacterium]|nr:adenylyltransferase/cytidyltransferase family protein [Patescibacteria group bacterium]
MNKIINAEAAEKVSKKLQKDGKVVVVSGGCFDILHIGHIKFLEKAKKEGDYLFILLEADETVKKLKGNKRPINNQKDRANMLSAISYVNYVVMLSEMKTDNDYDFLISKINPNIIATTKNDSQGVHNERQAKKINAKVSYVTNRIKNKSTSKLAEIISKNFDR